MRTEILIILSLFIILAALFGYLLSEGPADRFGTGGRLGSASSDQSNHYMRIEKLNKNQRLWINRYKP